MRAERLVAGVVGVAAASPATRWVAEQLGHQASLCPLQRLVGVPCPSCGGTRAALHLLAGQPLEALSLNLGASLFLVAVGVLIISGTVRPAEILGVAKPNDPVADLGR